MIRLHKEGTQILIVSLFIVLFLTGILFYTINNVLISTILVLCLFVFYFFEIWFFRNPIRNTVANFNDIVAPVDGKVVVIDEVFEKEFLKEKCIQVSIFMSPLNVHVCRYPVSGKVIYTKYHPGKYLVAWHPKSSELNERTTVVVENDNKNILFRQIAGAVARRIVLYPKVNDAAVAGTEYGFIKFGSRLDVFLPLGTQINVVLGQITKGGVDIIAKI